MPDASAFLRKRKDRNRVPSQRVSAPVRNATTPAAAGSSTHPPPFASRVALPASSSNGHVKVEENGETKPNPYITEIKLFSADPSTGLRYNMMKMNSGRDVDPTQITRPLMLNRKQPGPKTYPTYAIDEENKIVGKYVYDDKGEPVLGANGLPTIEKRDEGMDPSLVGEGLGQKRKIKKGLKEVFHQDLSVIRLRREEATPWVMESGRPKEKPNVPEYWVGRMTEPTALPTVLLVNDGSLESGFQVVPLGRTYRFEPERPFKVLDVDAAHKLVIIIYRIPQFEHQAKHKIHDRWAQRPDGPSIAGPSRDVKPKIEEDHQLRQEERAWRLEQKMKGTMNVKPKVKVERFEDDQKREGRQAERGLEGGADEDLDYDFNEDFQDDDDVNTFYRDDDEEEEAKLQDARIKKEQRMANANVGDRPQIASDDDEDDLFGENKLNSEGKKLRKMMRQRGGIDDYDSSDSEDSDSDAAPKDEKKKAEMDKEKDKGKPKEATPSAPPSVERPSRPPSRGPGHRGTSSQTGKRPNVPSNSKANTAPPGAGFISVAQRATRDDSPRKSRGNSPSGRAQSPDNGSGRAMSPPSRGGTPSRAMSPSASGPTSGSARAASPATREGSPSTAAGGPPRPSGKRKTTESPHPAPSPKRRPSPSGSTTSDQAPRSKKKKSATPDEQNRFEGQISFQEVLDYFRTQNTEGVLMRTVVEAFVPLLKKAAPSNMDANQKLLLRYVNKLTNKQDGLIVLKPEFRSN